MCYLNIISTIVFLNHCHYHSYLPMFLVFDDCKWWKRWENGTHILHIILNIPFLALTITNGQTKMRKRHGHRGLLVAQKEEWRQFRSKVNVSFKFLIVQNWKQWIQVRFSKPFLGAATYAEAEVNPWVHTSVGKNCRGLLGCQGDWSSLKLLVSAATSIFFAVAFKSFKRLFPIYLIFAQKAIFPTLCVLVKDWF